MREILFRGKTDDGEWAYGFLVKMFGAYHIIDKDDENTAYEVIPETVGQYTGLKDKNGKRIFEGDIIAVPYEEDRDPVEGTFIYYENGKVYFDETSFGWYVKFIGYALSLWEFDDCGVTIIGNVHDNKSLLNNQEAGE